MARGVPRLLIAALACTLAGYVLAQPPALAPQQSSAGVISESALRASVGYLASDELEGRATPSEGLDKAADFIAKQFEQAGLEPGAATYFQTAPYYGESVRNVVGLLRGSDALLRETYVIVSAHYDHLGKANSGKDRIYHGANDDASGVASMIEIARVLAHGDSRPARSVFFIAYFGEEIGQLGSFYYAEHPVVPLASTIAEVNLEQLGRPGKRNQVIVTGFGMTDLPARMEVAAKASGVKVNSGGKRSDTYFELSDNLALALQGVPAHTLTAAFDFRDYHTVHDNADKLDYANMAVIDQAIALGIIDLASAAAPPEWNPRSNAAQPYADAARKLHQATTRADH